MGWDRDGIYTADSEPLAMDTVYGNFVPGVPTPAVVTSAPGLRRPTWMGRVCSKILPWGL